MSAQSNLKKLHDLRLLREQIGLRSLQIAKAKAARSSEAIQKAQIDHRNAVDARGYALTAAVKSAKGLGDFGAQFARIAVAVRKHETLVKASKKRILTTRETLVKDTQTAVDAQTTCSQRTRDRIKLDNIVEGQIAFAKAHVDFTEDEDVADVFNARFGR